MHKWILAIPCLFAIGLSFQFGLGVDEAHYMLYAKYLDWSYFDHPPLVGWMHLPFNILLGWNEFAARLPAIMIGYFTTLKCYQYLQSKGYSEKDSLSGALALWYSFIIFALFLFLLPDSFLLLGIFYLLQFTEKSAARNSGLKYWCGLGITLGLLGLAKYTAILLVIPIAIYIIEKRGFRVFKDRGLYVSLFLAAVLICPVLYWNYQHEWISLKYQLSHVASGQGIRYQSIFESLAGQIAAYNPLLFPFAIAGFLTCWKSRRSAFRLEFLILMTIFLFFIKSSFWEPILPHWTSAFYILVIPIGVANFWPKIFRSIAIGTTLIYVLLFSELVFHWIPQATAGYRDITGYDQLAREVIAKTDTKTGIAVTNWTYASRLMFYLKGEREVVVLDDRKDQFDLWSAEPKGRDLLLLLFSFDNESSEKFPCREREDKGVFKAQVGDREVYSVRLVLCRHLLF